MPIPPRALFVSLTLLASIVLLPAAQPAAAQAGGSPAALPNSAYYRATGIDPRMCPSPVCGGVLVSLVNRRATRCADGTWAAQCHAPILDWSALGLDGSETLALEDAFRAGRVLARGRLQTVDTPFGPLPSLIVGDAWRGATGNAPSGSFFGVRSSGIVCITYPCPTLALRKLNLAVRRPLHDIDLAASGADPTTLDAGYAALYQGSGLLVAGALERFSGPAGRGHRLVASEFYTPVESRTGGRCTGGEPLPPPPDACITLWDPVCGCDGVTYGNDCERERAGVALDYSGMCRNQ